MQDFSQEVVNGSSLCLFALLLKRQFSLVSSIKKNINSNDICKILNIKVIEFKISFILSGV